MMSCSKLMTTRQGTRCSPTFGKVTVQPEVSFTENRSGIQVASPSEHPPGALGPLLRQQLAPQPEPAPRSAVFLDAVLRLKGKRRADRQAAPILH